MTRHKILVWLSGGVDSAVSAYLLREAGYEVSCGFMINYLDEEHPESCSTRADLDEARQVAEFLGLPFYTFDYREEYEKRIVEYIYREYALGRTPNPDVFCNNLIKFDLFLEEALALGFDAIAMGHYARLENLNVWMFESWDIQDSTFQHSNTPTYSLLKWIDPSKDQSYFLSRLSPFQLAHARFPIGQLHKHEVRAIARNIWLPNAERKDSQGLCFIGKVSMREFLERRLERKPGDILSKTGEILGEHEGAFSYTIGQRRGIEIGGGPALFVIAKDTTANTITVWEEHDLQLFASECMLSDWVWEILDPSRKYGAKIRYRQEDQSIEIRNENGEMRVVFDTPQRAIASGQICVLYDGDRVVGSGVIV
jgi:tRNA-uridine 2-sulfurtransferase